MEEPGTNNTPEKPKRSIKGKAAKIAAFIFFTPNGSNVFLAIAFKKLLNRLGVTFTPALIATLIKLSIGLGIWTLYRKSKAS